MSGYRGNVGLVRNNIVKISYFLIPSGFIDSERRKQWRKVANNFSSELLTLLFTGDVGGGGINGTLVVERGTALGEK